MPLPECDGCGAGSERLELVVGYKLCPLCRNRFMPMVDGQERVEYEKLKAAVDARRKENQ